MTGRPAHPSLWLLLCATESSKAVSDTVGQLVKHLLIVHGIHCLDDVIGRCGVLILVLFIDKIKGLHYLLNFLEEPLGGKPRGLRNDTLNIRVTVIGKVVGKIPSQGIAIELWH